MNLEEVAALMNAQDAEEAGEDDMTVESRYNTVLFSPDDKKSSQISVDADDLGFKDQDGNINFNINADGTGLKLVESSNGYKIVLSNAITNTLPQLMLVASLTAAIN